MVSRSWLICKYILILNVFVKTNAIAQRRDHPYSATSRRIRPRGVLNFITVDKARIPVFISTTSPPSEKKMEERYHPYTTTSTTHKPGLRRNLKSTTTKTQMTVDPQYDNENPLNLYRPVTGRHPLLMNLDPRPLITNNTPSEDLLNFTLPLRYNVSLEGFHLALSIVILAEQFADQQIYLEHSLESSYYYNKIYRVMLRHIAAVKEWFAGEGSYTDSHRLWRKKLDYVHEFVPTWLRRFIPWVPKSEWAKEEENYYRFTEEIEMKHIFIHNPYYQGKGMYWEKNKRP